jgi:hypothetical protein
VLANEGDPLINIAHIGRERKQNKQRGWFEKSHNKTSQKTSAPQSGGVERIQVLETSVTKQKLIRTSAGTILSIDLDQDESHQQLPCRSAIKTGVSRHTTVKENNEEEDEDGGRNSGSESKRSPNSPLTMDDDLGSNVNSDVDLISI